ncbi:MAG: hypothetical protein KDD47_22310, partial [Acidobacteria bacterium]|nr:hypothetical protein [Acidobacteriota bacterium]
PLSRPAQASRPGEGAPPPTPNGSNGWPLGSLHRRGTACRACVRTALIDRAPRLPGRRGTACRALARNLLSLALIAALAVPSPASAYETDQYSNRLLPVTDSGELFDARVNEAIEDVAAHWQGPRNDYRFARKIYWRLGGLHWVDHIERWAMKNPEIEKLPQRRHKSIYSGAPLFYRRVNALFGVGRTMKIHGVLLGSDKLGHFFSQGVKYYRRHLGGASDERLLAVGRKRERGIFGQRTTSVFSNADLVANYEGYLFYRSLFEDDIVPGKPALLIWQGDRPVPKRPFTFADHVNDYWDEALNPSHFSPGLRHWMAQTLLTLCPLYQQHPEAYEPNNDQALAERYKVLGLKPAVEGRVGEVCG